MLMGNAEKVVLITGASSGIGASIANVFGENKMKVMVNYNSNQTGAETVVDEINQTEPLAELYQADVTRKDEVNKMIAEIIEKYGRIDILVNNAGSVLSRKTFLECTDDLWKKTLDLNLTSVFYSCQAVIPHMIENGGGRIINISSISPQHGGAFGSIHYATAKGALNILTKGLAQEFAEHNILVNAVAPGVVLTPFQEKHSTENRLNTMIDKTYLKRAAQPEEIAELVAFLGSEKSSFITGEVLPISGGR